MKWRIFLAGLAAALAPGCAAGPGPVPVAAPLSLRVRAEVLSEVIIMRYGRISNWGQVDACSVYRALGGDPGFRERLDTTSRSKLTNETAATCASARPDEHARGRWYIREITRGGPAEITVRVGVIGDSGTHRELYVLDQGYGHGVWRLHHVRMDYFSID
jgi:hypothetical protein